MGNRKITYSELFRMMESGDKTQFRFSNWFWHYTHVDNLIKIVESGLFQARYNIEGNIPYDIRKHNKVSSEVQDTNISWRLQRHVRFYLRPLNAPFFSAKNSLDDENNMVLITITKDALYRSKNSTFLHYKNAHGAPTNVFEKENQLNFKLGNPFYLLNLEKFRFDETYSKYDKNQTEERKNYQQAEFLVWKELPISFINKIYFRNKIIMAKFLSSIVGLACYNEIERKCDVNSDLFYADGYK